MDNIFGNRFLGRAPAWHSLGNIIDPDQPLSVQDAVAVAGADFKVELQPVFVEAFGQRVETGKVAIMRAPLPDDPEPRLFGFAGKNYQVVQNTEFAALVGDLAEREGWPVETVGVLGKGEKFFLTLKTASVDIKGDGEVVIYFLVSDGKDGGTATRIACTPVRVVCQNTLIMGLQQAIIQAQVTHRGKDLHSEIKFNLDVVAGMKKAQDAVTAAMGIMARPKARLSEEEVDLILDAPYPTLVSDTRGIAAARQMIDGSITLDEARAKGLTGKVTKWDQWVESVKIIRGAARDRLRIFNDEYPKVADTPWAVYNAVAETEQYRKGKSDSVSARDMLFGGYRGQNVEKAFAASYRLALAKN